MKPGSLLTGLAIGVLLGFFLTRLFTPGNALRGRQDARVSAGDGATTWHWADSLDAVKAASHNHKVIFENKEVRILEVTLDPYEYEQLHTHRFPSVMFGPDTDTSSFDIIYYPYRYDTVTRQYVAKDSIKQHQGGQPAGPADDKANYMRPEGPHRIRNLSNVRILAYRVEFKTGAPAGSQPQ